MKLGLIVRDNDRGLGIQSWEFYKHLKPYKTLALEFAGEECFRERYKNARFCINRIENEDIDWLLDGADIVLSFETFYNNYIIEKARQKKVKTILQTNYEWYEGQRPDLIIAPSLWHYDRLPEPKTYLPVPINRELLPFKLRDRAKIFLHNTGNLKAGYDRNGTELLLKAIPLVKSDVKFIIKSQVPVEKIKDKRVEYIVKNKKNYWDCWKVNADILVSPRRYGGLSLPLNEAMSVGMPIIMTDIKPQNEFLPKELLVEPEGFGSVMIKQNVEVVDISPERLAKKIDEVANMPSYKIKQYSKWSNYIAEEWSWDKLLPKYLKTFYENK
jgi:glycosyltransferase involved in cell wall biosynthesis